MPSAFFRASCWTSSLSYHSDSATWTPKSAESRLVFRSTCACSHAAERDMAMLIVHCEDINCSSMRTPTPWPPAARNSPKGTSPKSPANIVWRLYSFRKRHPAVLSYNEPLGQVPISDWIFECNLMQNIRPRLDMPGRLVCILQASEKAGEIRDYPQTAFTKSICHPRIAIMHGSTNLGTHPWPGPCRRFARNPCCTCPTNDG